MEQTKEQKLQEEVSMAINGSFDAKAFAKAFAKDHRTLQETFTKVCIAWLEELATNGSIDLRNQSAYEFAKKVMTVTTEEERFMPFI